MRFLINQINMEMQTMRQYMRDHSYEQKFPEMMNRDYYSSTRLIEEPRIGSASYRNHQQSLFDWENKSLMKPFWDK